MNISYLKRERIHKNSEYKCVYCGKSLEEMIFYKTYTIDHKIPIAKGGGNEEENLVISCRSCNSRKGTKTHNQYIKFINIYKTERYKKYIKEGKYFNELFKDIMDNN